MQLRMLLSLSNLFFRGVLMKHFKIITLIAFLSTFANAFGDEALKACYRNIKTKEEAVGKESLKKVMLYFDKGQSLGGKFPKCEDVVNVANQTKARIAEKFKNTCIDPDIVADMENSNYRLSYQFLQSEFNDSTYSFRMKKGSEGEIAQSKVTIIPYQNFGCFDDQTRITVMNNSTHEVKMQSFEDFVIYWNNNQHANTFEDIYVLSSPIEMIPDAASEYLGSCWTRVKGYTVAGLNAGKVDDICTVSWDATDGTYGKCVATPDHRFRVEITDANGNKTYQWKQLKDVNTDKMRFVNEAGKSVTVFSIIKDKVKDVNWVRDDMKVYNLMTESGVYYIGDPNRRALVHNVY
jgi:hypothetical protein